MNTVMSVIRWELRELRRAPLTWGLPLAGLCVLEVAIYPSVSKSLAKAVASYPDTLKKVFNLDDISSVQAFLDVEMFSLIVPLAIAFFGIRAALRSTVGAEDRGWLDLLLSAPLSRTKLVAGSFTGTLVSLWLVLGVVGVLSELTSVIAGVTIPVDLMLAGLASMWALAVFFSGVAVLAAGLFHGNTVGTAIATGALMGMYTLDLVGKLVPSLSGLRWLSAFRYAESALKDGLDVAGFATLTVAGLVCAVAGALLFARRDVLAG